MSVLSNQLQTIQSNLAAERAKGADGDKAQIAQWEQDEANTLSQMDSEAQQAQADHSGGLKEVIYQVFDSVLPKDVASRIFGLTEFDELAQSFRQAIDLAVDENNDALFAVIGEQLEAKDSKIREVTTKNIGLDSQLQESIRENHAAQADIYDLNELLAAKDEQLKAKDEQIAKLTEELNAVPQSNDIVAPEAKPSQSLEELLQKNTTKSMTNLERVLAGMAPQRGSVTIGGETTTTPEWQAIVPTFGGSEDNNTFQGQDPTAITQGSGLDIPQVGESFPTPTVSNENNALDGQSADGTVETETITRAEFQALTERVARLEQGNTEVAA